MDVVACFPLHIRMLESVFCSIIEAFALETAKIVIRVFLGLVCVSLGDNFALELIGNGKKAEGEVVEDGKADDDSCGDSEHNGGENGKNGDASGGEWTGSDDGDDNESDEDDASDQQGSDDGGKKHDDNGDEEDEEISEEEDFYSGSSSDEDDDPILDHAMEVYASDSFSLFRHEYEKGMALSVDCVDGSKSVWKYEVKRNEDKNCDPICYKVSASYFCKTVECCCNHFAVSGMLCSHALAVLKSLHIDHTPDQYLLKWRLKTINQRCFIY